MTSMTAALKLTLRACSQFSIGSMLKTWHRTAGVFAAAFLLVLTLTGLLLMQTDQLNLDDRLIANPRLLDWYGIRPAPPPQGARLSRQWVSQVGTRLYLDATFVSEVHGQLVGAVAGRENIVATEQELLSISADGQINEVFDALSGLPPELRTIGLDRNNRIVVKNRDAAFVFDPEAGTFASTDAAESITWSQTEMPPSDLRAVIERDYRGAGLSMERVLLDLHTGRLFGAAGEWFVNVAAALTLLLIVSGALLWLGRNRRH